MPARIIYEVVRNTANGPIEVGSVTDDFIGKQVIDRLYEMVRQLSLEPDRLAMSIDFPDGVWDSIDTYGWDQWSINNRNSAAPMFYMRKRLLFNNVPSTLGRWHMGEASDNFSQFPGDIPRVIESVDTLPTL